jgi:hypothetical protein
MKERDAPAKHTIAKLAVFNAVARIPLTRKPTPHGEFRCLTTSMEANQSNVVLGAGDILSHAQVRVYAFAKWLPLDGTYNKGLQARVR